MRSPSARFIVITIAVSGVALLTWILLNRPQSRNVILDPPVPGLGAAVQIDVTEPEPPIHLEGNRVVSVEGGPEWLSAVTALLSPADLSWGDLEKVASPEYLKANNITPELLAAAKRGPAQHSPRVSIVYYLKVTADSGEFILVAHVIGPFVSAPPANPADVGLILLKKISGRWLQYPYQDAVGVKTIPWNDLSQLNKIIAAKRATLGEAGKLIPR